MAAMKRQFVSHLIFCTNVSTSRLRNSTLYKMRVLHINPTQLRLCRVVCPHRQIGSRSNALSSFPRFQKRLRRQFQPLGKGSMSSTTLNSTEAEISETKNQVKSTSRVIVVAVDETEDSVKAMKWTIEQFYRKGDTLHLLHVIPFVHQQVMTSTVYYTPPILDPELSEQLYENAEEVVNENFIPVLDTMKVKYEVDMVQEKGSETIGEAVCHAASDVGACAVVVAAHKKHWLQTWLMGSSSREIAGKAPIPVIVYHG